MDGDDGDVHAVLEVGRRVEVELFGHLAVQRPQDFLGVGDVLLEDDGIEKVVTHDGHEGRRNPVSGAIGSSHDLDAISRSGPEEVPAHEVLRLEKDEAIVETPECGILASEDGLLNGGGIVQTFERAAFLLLKRGFGVQDAVFVMARFLSDVLHEHIGDGCDGNQADDVERGDEGRVGLHKGVDVPSAKNGEPVEGHGRGEAEKAPATLLEDNAAQHGRQHEEHLIAVLIAVDHDDDQGPQVDPNDQQGLGQPRPELGQGDEWRGKEPGHREVDRRRGPVPHQGEQRSVERGDRHAGEADVGDEPGVSHLEWRNPLVKAEVADRDPKRMGRWDGHRMQGRLE